MNKDARAHKEHDMKVIIMVEADRFRAEYRGGPYIDLIDPYTDEAYDCINVWDYENSKPTIAFTPDDVKGAIAELELDDSRRKPWEYNWPQPRRATLGDKGENKNG